MKSTICHTVPSYVISKLFIIGTALLFFLVPQKLTAQTNIKVNVNNGDVVNLVPLPPAGCYTWTNDNTTMGLPASGVGNIPSFTAKNKGTAPIIVTITATTKPLNQYAYIGTTEVQTLSVVNLVTNVEEATIPINSEVWGIAISPDDRYVYISSAKQIIGTVVNNVISKFDTQTRTVVATYPVFSPQLKVSPDGKTLYVAGGLILETKNLTKIGTFKTANFSASLALSPDGTKIYTTNSVYDIPTQTLTTINTGGNYDLVISPDGKKLYISGNSPTAMFVYDISTNTNHKIITGQPSANIAISPDGSRIYVDNYITGDVLVIDAATEQVVKTLVTGFKHKGISVGLSGDRLVCIDEHGGSAIYSTTDYSLVKRFEALNYIGFATNTYGKFTTTGSCYAPNVTYTITVYPEPAIINTSGTLSAMTTTYGTPSSPPNSFTVSGADLDGGILVQPPAGFEVSTDQVTYKDDLTIPAAGTIVSNTTVYVRLKGTAPVKSYGGNVVLSSAATTVNVAIPTSTINKAPLTVSSKPIKKTYGSVLSGSITTANVLAPGLKNNETIGSISITYGSGGKATDPVSIYVDAVKVAAATGGTYTPSNYLTPTYVNGNLEVIGAPLTITADDKERFYGDINPVFTFKYSGFVNNEGVAQLTTLPVGNSAGPTAAIGKYPITISGAVAPNYTLNYVPGALTVKSTLVTVNTAFTPNDDGINDTWEINKIGQYNNCTVEVLNRYGEKVFYSIGYPVAWNGKRAGANLPTGTYYYIIKLNSSMKPLTGYLAIIR
ncbi:gliding motility-associated C-terminal domain-containing protein [Mucilaginibacter sp. UYCu711]|uniref:T9SS type B sorting domain-containing protein n=1 Tax=Mucilaginibacter sp. UYCu711 TaxID=3156339 RepID=UPI003D1F0352